MRGGITLPRMPRALCVAVLAVLVWPAGASAAQRKPRPLPLGFIGMLADGPLMTDPRVDMGQEVALMRSSGVQSVRFTIYWDQAQPYATAADVPAAQAGRFAVEGGVPTDLQAIDRFVGLAAQNGLRMQPVVLRAPAWAAEHPGLEASPPSAPGMAAYARFLQVLIGRYGPHGSFWSAHPEVGRVPIRRWQIWNEPGGSYDWSDQPAWPAYVALLRQSYTAVKAADPKAKVILAGLVGHSWEELREVYRHGGGRYFDVAAVHPFTLQMSNFRLILRLVRRVMGHYGDARKPLALTEVSWPSGKDVIIRPFGYEVTPRGQARKITAVYRKMASERRRFRIAGLYWSTWMSYDRDITYPFDFAGIRRFDGTQVIAKPAFFAFRRVAHRLER
jgi:hypothetical protein